MNLYNFSQIAIFVGGALTLLGGVGSHFLGPEQNKINLYKQVLLDLKNPLIESGYSALRILKATSKEKPKVLPMYMDNLKNDLFFEKIKKLNYVNKYPISYMNRVPGHP